MTAGSDVFRFAPCPSCCEEYVQCIIFEDDFERDNSSDIGSPYQEVSGDWEIVDGKLVCTNAGSHNQPVVFDQDPSVPYQQSEGVFNYVGEYNGLPYYKGAYSYYPYSSQTWYLWYDSTTFAYVISKSLGGSVDDDEDAFWRQNAWGFAPAGGYTPHGIMHSSYTGSVSYAGDVPTVVMIDRDDFESELDSAISIDVHLEIGDSARVLWFVRLPPFQWYQYCELERTGASTFKLSWGEFKSVARGGFGTEEVLLSNEGDPHLDSVDPVTFKVWRSGSASAGGTAVATLGKYLSVGPVYGKTLTVAEFQWGLSASSPDVTFDDLMIYESLWWMKEYSREEFSDDFGREDNDDPGEQWVEVNGDVDIENARMVLRQGDPPFVVMNPQGQTLDIFSVTVYFYVSGGFQCDFRIYTYPDASDLDAHGYVAELQRSIDSDDSIHFFIVNLYYHNTLLVESDPFVLSWNRVSSFTIKHACLDHDEYANAPTPGVSVEVNDEERVVYATQQHEPFRTFGLWSTGDFPIILNKVEAHYIDCDSWQDCPPPIHCYHCNGPRPDGFLVTLADFLQTDWSDVAGRSCSDCADLNDTFALDFGGYDDISIGWNWLEGEKTCPNCQGDETAYWYFGYYSYWASKGASWCCYSYEFPVAICGLYRFLCLFIRWVTATTYQFALGLRRAGSGLSLIYWEEVELSDYPDCTVSHSLDFELTDSQLLVGAHLGHLCRRYVCTGSPNPDCTGTYIYNGQVRGQPSWVNGAYILQFSEVTWNPGEPDEWTGNYWTISTDADARLVEGQTFWYSGDQIPSTGATWGFIPEGAATGNTSMDLKSVITPVTVSPFWN